MRNGCGSHRWAVIGAAILAGASGCWQQEPAGEPSADSAAAPPRNTLPATDRSNGAGGFSPTLLGDSAWPRGGGRGTTSEDNPTPASPGALAPASLPPPSAVIFDALDSVRHVPGWERLFTAIAWRAATHDDDRVRDPSLAEALLAVIQQQGGELRADALDALAAARAARGDTQQAASLAALARRKLGLAEQAYSEQVAQRERRFAQGLPYLEPAPRFDPAHARGTTEEARAALLAHAAAWLRAQGRWDEAIDLYSRALAVDEKFRHAHLMLAEVRTEQGLYSAAQDHYRAALKLANDDPDAHYALAMLAWRGGDRATAVVELRVAHQQGPDMILAGNNLAWLLATEADPDLRRPEEAARVAERMCAATQPTHPRLLDTLAAAYAAGGRFEDAERALEQAAELARRAPAQPSTPLDAVLGPLRAEEIEFRRAQYRARRSPRDAFADRIELAQVALAAGDAATAVKFFEQARQLQSGRAEAEFGLAAALQSQGREYEAAGVLLEVCKQQPDLLEAVNNLAWLLATSEDPRVRDPRLAVSFAERCCQDKAGPPSGCLDTLAAAYAADGRFTDAVRTMRRALAAAEKAEPGAWATLAAYRLRLSLYEAGRPFANLPRAHAEWGLLCGDRGDLEQAETHFNAARELDPSHVEALYGLASVRQRQGRVREAIGLLQELLRGQPDSAAALNNLAWMLATAKDKRLRDPTEAVRLAERARALSRGADPHVLDTLAAAYAAAGRPADAQQTAAAVAPLVEKIPDADQRARWQRRLAERRLPEPADETPRAGPEP